MPRDNLNDYYDATIDARNLIKPFFVAKITWSILANKFTFTWIINEHFRPLSIIFSGNMI